jgi:carbon monoxide dehydrogenase subunit G
MNAPVDQVRAVLSDPQQLQQAMPGVKSVDILSRTDHQARVAITTSLTMPGAVRVEGDAFITQEGIRFTAAQPMPLSLDLAAVPQGDGSQVTARIESELPPGLGAMARFIPQRVIEERVGAELDRALERLERVVQS